MIENLDLLVIRLDALRSVYRKDAEYTLRCICRWYSEHFNTPLYEVGTRHGRVELEEVLRTFYEVRYSEWDEKTPSKLEEEAELLLRSDDDDREAALKADVDEAEGWAFARMIEAREEAQRKKDEEKARKAREAQKLEDTKVANAEEREALVTMRHPEAPPDTGRPLGKGKRGGAALAPSLLPEGPTEGVPVVPGGVQKKHTPGRAVETTLPEDVQVVFMTEAEMEADAVDPFSIEKPAQSKGQRPPPKKK